ncbi:hypothetical protein OEZ86_005375 [Tetradesmus obliquus]|nr:hypothetical protein OEZ86_005375 [Tetradesmus obliquus]
MQEQQGNSVLGGPLPCYSLGDVLEGVASRLQQEFAELVGRTTTASVESRPQELLQFVHGTRQQLLRSAAILHDPRKLGPLAQLVAPNGVLDIAAQHARHLQTAADELFKANGELRSGRVPLFNIPSALDVLSTGTYSSLPASIQDMRGPRSLPEAQQQRLVRHLNHLLYAQLLKAHLPDCLELVQVTGGYAVLSCKGLYEVQLSLFQQPYPVQLSEAREAAAAAAIDGQQQQQPAEPGGQQQQQQQQQNEAGTSGTAAAAATQQDASSSSSSSPSEPEVQQVPVLLAQQPAGGGSSSAAAAAAADPAAATLPAVEVGLGSDGTAQAWSGRVVLRPGSAYGGELNMEMNILLRHHQEALQAKQEAARQQLLHRRPGATEQQAAITALQELAAGLTDLCTAAGEAAAAAAAGQARKRKRSDDAAAAAAAAAAGNAETPQEDPPQQQQPEQQQQQQRQPRVRGQLLQPEEHVAELGAAVRWCQARLTFERIRLELEALQLDFQEVQLLQLPTSARGPAPGTAAAAAAAAAAADFQRQQVWQQPGIQLLGMPGVQLFQRLQRKPGCVPSSLGLQEATGPCSSSTAAAAAVIQ